MNRRTLIAAAVAAVFSEPAAPMVSGSKWDETHYVIDDMPDGSQRGETWRNGLLVETWRGRRVNGRFVEEPLP